MDRRCYYILKHLVLPCGPSYFHLVSLELEKAIFGENGLNLIRLVNKMIFYVPRHLLISATMKNKIIDVHYLKTFGALNYTADYLKNVPKCVIEHTREFLFSESNNMR